MIDLDLGAPRPPSRTVLPEWIDWNGHMNVGFCLAFDKATDTLCAQFGCSWEYTRDKIGMTFVLRRRHLRPGVKQGDALRITTQILDPANACITSVMYHADEGYLAATNELMPMNIDYATRRSAPWPFAMERIDKLAAKKLPVPSRQAAHRHQKK
jgi:acyl-CoA thioester hydrolase